MGINVLDRAGFEAMVDFVQKSYDQLEVSGTTTLDPQQVENQERFEREKDELVSKLDGSIREAQAQKQRPVEQLLKDVRGAVRTAMPNAEANPALIKHFEQEGEAARQRQDGFGAGDNSFALPSVFGEALGFLKSVFADKPVAPKAQPKTDAKAEAKPTPSTVPTQQLLAGEGQVQQPERDPAVAEFVRQYYGDAFEAKPAQRAERESAPQLSKAEAEVLEKLPAEDKAFAKTLPASQRSAFAQMPKEEQTFFRGMKPSERGQYMAMAPDERAFVRALKPDERAAYLVLHPDQRELVRKQGPEGLKSLGQPEQFKGFEKKEPVEVARTVSSDVLQVLGQTKPEQGKDPKNQHAQLVEKTQGLMMNFLQADPKNVGAARVQTLKALLNTPETQKQLLSDLEERLGALDKKKGNGPAKSYQEHFKKIGPLVLEHAQRLLNPNLDREGLLQGLERAVEVSAEFASAHPPRKRDLRASKNLKFRFITG